MFSFAFSSRAGERQKGRFHVQICLFVLGSWFLFWALPSFLFGEDKLKAGDTFARSIEHDRSEWTRSISIPASLAREKDEYLCTSIALEHPSQTIQKFVPKAREGLVHHMLLFSCSNEPQPSETARQTVTKDGKEVVVWKCGYEGGEGICPRATAGSFSNSWSKVNILYGWAKGAGSFDTGSDSGFVLGSRAGLDSSYVVLQSHFLRTVSEEDNEEEKAEIELVFKSQIPEKILSINTLANSLFTLPPREDEVDVDAKCCMRGGQSAELFAYRVHAHSYSRNISLRVSGELVAWGDPQLPHFFTKVNSNTNGAPIKLNHEEEWAVTCSYNTQGTSTPVPVGEGSAFEMCNMYLMLSSHVPFNADFDVAFHQPMYNYPNCTISGKEEEDSDGGAETSAKQDKLTRIRVIERSDLGQIAGLHLGYQGKAHQLLIFHRGLREMTEEDHEKNIESDVLMVWDTKENRVLSTFGKNRFKLPHGLTIDRENNIWLTDVDTQLAYKLDPSGKEILLTVGTNAERGHDLDHLCRPTEVAVANSGAFFVSDGYCNDRVMKYDAAGRPVGEFRLPGALVPHELVLDDCLGLLYVADREQARIRIVQDQNNTGAEINIVDMGKYGLVYSITRDEYGNIYLLTWDRDFTGKSYIVQLQFKDPRLPFRDVSLTAVELPGIHLPHDFAVTYNFAQHSLDFFVGETGPGVFGRITQFRYALGSG